MRVLVADLAPPITIDPESEAELPVPSNLPNANLRATPPRSLLRSAFQAGLLGAPLNLIPFFGGMILTGVMSAILHQRATRQKLTTAIAARLGAIAGSISFIATVVVAGVLTVLLNKQEQFRDAVMKAVEEKAGTAPDADMQAALQFLHKPEGFATALLFSLAVLLILSMIASALGSTITAAVSRDRGRGSA